MPVVFPSLEGDHLGHDEMRIENDSKAPLLKFRTIKVQHTVTRFLMIFVSGPDYKNQLHFVD